MARNDFPRQVMAYNPKQSRMGYPIAERRRIYSWQERRFRHHKVVGWDDLSCIKSARSTMVRTSLFFEFFP